MSLMGRKKLDEYWSEATSEPSVSAPIITHPPPNQMISAAAIALINSMAG